MEVAAVASGCIDTNLIDFTTGMAKQPKFLGGPVAEVSGTNPKGKSSDYQACKILRVRLEHLSPCAVDTHHQAAREIDTLPTSVHLTQSTTQDGIIPREARTSNIFLP